MLSSDNTFPGGNWIKPVLIVAGIIAALIVFEGAQQFYYLRRYNLFPNANITLLELIIGHLKSWLIWMLAGAPLVVFALRHPFDKEGDYKSQALIYFGWVFGILLLCMVLIALEEVFFQGAAATLERFIGGLTFYTFQKGPIFLLAYASLIITLHFFVNIQTLELTVKELSSMKVSNQSLYEELKAQQYEDSTQFITVKTGNRSRVVALDDIRWVEADDYCVRLHTRTDEAYVLRGSMKAMEQALPGKKFIRIHRKCIVNLNDVDEFLFSDTPEVILTGGMKLPVAVSRVGQIKKHLKLSQ
ncbi:LytTR family DNA-binding domain-containing protein [uncultured Imperialibacter sp.]|uniref:LytR/AlgR family response regulator transcription factor n=1 Tax=uncultured Imperialibacter sp. TaxID=1672639 RepID=UPI0030DA73A4|tara:strand:+ start:354 stop:1256 length:903 start_codon:yes stop_codon:yes gene_type:complete